MKASVAMVTITYRALSDTAFVKKKKTGSAESHRPKVSSTGSSQGDHLSKKMGGEEEN